MFKDLFKGHKYFICASLSTFSLIFTSISVISLSRSVNEVSNKLESISKWADSQNECVTKTYRINGKNTQGIVSKVWSCNGGGE